jgi:hypothetical protein
MPTEARPVTRPATLWLSSQEEQRVAPSNASPTTNLGFLTVLHEPSGHLGGYLVTNVWGRPLEFRLSTAVQPNRVQQILYGQTLESYIHADLIGKTLIDKTATPVQLVITDSEPVLDLRLRLEIPVVWLAAKDDPQAAALAGAGAELRPPDASHGPLFRHPRYPGDGAALQELLQRLDGQLDLSEPFGRIREAISEARKMGVTNRN